MHASRQRFLINLLLLIASSFITLALAEVTLRLAGHRLLGHGEWFSVGQIYRRPDPPVGFSLEPHSSQVDVSGGAYIFKASINSEGLRDVEHPLHKQPGTYLGAFSVDDQSMAGKEWEHAYRILDELRRLVSANGSRLAVILVPAPFQTSERAWTAWVKSWGTPAKAVSRRRPQEMMMAWSARSGTPCLDLLGSFQDVDVDRYYFPYDGHWTAQGHRLAAHSVSEFLAAQRLP